MPFVDLRARHVFYESRSSGLERKFVGKFQLKLNIGSKPIVYKYHEGKMKRTLKRELKVSEIAEMEAHDTSAIWRDCCMPGGGMAAVAQAQRSCENSWRVVLLAICVSRSMLAIKTPGTCTCWTVVLLMCLAAFVCAVAD